MGQRVAFIDLSLTGTGVAQIFHGGPEVGASVALAKLGITNGQGKGLQLGEHAKHLEAFAFDICERATCGDLFIEQPTHIGIELPALSMSRGGVFERGHVFYTAIGELVERGIVVVGVTPGQIKQYVTGKGSASKGAVIDALARRWPEFEHGGDEDLADAAGGAVLLADVLGFPLATVPAQHRKAADAVRQAAGL